MNNIEKVGGDLALKMFFRDNFKQVHPGLYNFVCMIKKYISCFENLIITLNNSF